jgi:hypothetical protein
MSDLLILDEEKKSNNSNSNPNNAKDISLMDKINSFLLSKQALKVKQKVIFFRLLSTMINA